MKIHSIKQNDRYVCEYRGNTYYLTFEQLNALKSGSIFGKNQYYDIDAWFNGLPGKEKMKVRPDYISSYDNGYYPDIIE